jgi:hypothetical protein
MLIFNGKELLAPCPTPILEEHRFARCLWLLILFIRSYHPQLETIPSIHNLKTCHAVVTRGPPNTAFYIAGTLYDAKDPENMT